MNIINTEFTLNGRFDFSLDFENPYFIVKTNSYKKKFLLPFKFIKFLTLFASFFSMHLVKLILKLDYKLKIKKPINELHNNKTFTIHKKHIDELLIFFMALKSNNAFMDFDYVLFSIYTIAGINNLSCSAEYEESEAYNTSYWESTILFVEEQLKTQIVKILKNEFDLKQAVNKDLKKEIAELLPKIDKHIYNFINTFDFENNEEENKEKLMHSFLKHHLSILNNPGINIEIQDLLHLSETTNLNLKSLANLMFHSMIKEHYNINKQNYYVECIKLLYNKNEETLNELYNYE